MLVSKRINIMKNKNTKKKIKIRFKKRKKLITVALKK